jgi:GNAT superfamily N-acetyltransferase
VSYSELLFDRLVAEGAAGDGRFLRRLAEEWQAGTMRFDGPGETLLGAFADGKLVGVAGVSHDPYAPAAGLGRVRHVYVAKALRGGGIGRALMEQLVQHAREHFTSLRLSTETPEAMSLYESFGFTPTSEFKGSHRLDF